jgi:membrane-associated phospholipid phosphatase
MPKYKYANMQPLFYKFWENIKNCFKNKNLKYHLIAILATYIIVVSDFDWKYFQFFAGSILSDILFSAALVGFLVPFLIPIFLLVYGKIRKNVSRLNTGFALGQATIIGYLISSFYKVWTGRAAPPLNYLNNAILDIKSPGHITSSISDISKIFHFGFLGNGIFWGWPSTHTTIAFAMAFTLFILYSKNKTVKILALIYALYIGIGVSMTIHWFSDFVAGAIIGTVIGIVVGKAFKER